MKAADWIALAVSLAVVVLFSARLWASAGVPQSVSIVSPTGTWLYPLSQDREVSGFGPPGTCVISIRSGSARVISSNCPQMICIKMGSISKPGQWIACLPHRIMITITGKPPDAVDSLSY